jgi:uncharacterized protein YndB with AHSA1/START domain
MVDAAEPVVKTIRIEATPEQVFDFIVQPSNMVRWLGLRVDFEPRPGGTVRIDPNGRDVIRGTVLEIRRFSKIVFTWGWEAAGVSVLAGSTIVDIVLERDGAATRLTLTHRDLPPDMRGRHEVGWTHYLARLKTVTEGGDAGPDSLVDPASRHG